ncbi:MAG: replicative DNA helicase [Bacteroidetes bacterium]|nr:replicative DNA helicase [Bacteroidota bacterium]
MTGGGILNEGFSESEYGHDRPASGKRSDRKIVPLTSGQQDRVPPHSNDAEMAVLGAMMLEKEAGSKVIQILPPDAFYREAHRIIYQAMLALAERNQPIDIITLNDELRRIGKLADVGGSHYLSELNLRTPTAANVEHHARIVFEKSLKRRLIHAATEIIGNCFNETTDAFEEVDHAEQRIFEIAENRNTRSYHSIKRLAIETVEMLESIHARRKEGNTILGVPSGLISLDGLTGGFQKSDLIILAARPSMGKTALAMTIARNAAIDYKKGVAFFSLEMAALQLVVRLLAAESRINAQQLRNGDLKDEEWQTLVSKIHHLVDSPLYIDDTPALGIMELRARARLMKREHNIEMLVVDYLQLMHAPKAESREREISMISRGLKQLAKELDIPIIALSQLNRSVESRGDKRPMLSDLRESGSIEQDADVVMFVHRPEYYGINVDEDGHPTQGMAEVIIGKQRNGPTGIAKTAFLNEYARFENLAYHHDNAAQYLPPSAIEEAPF